MNETGIELHLEKISRQLDKLTNPFKVAGLQFTAGIFHSLGNLFGMVVISIAIYYFVASLNIDVNKMVTKYVQSLIPKPQFTIQNPF